MPETPSRNYWNNWILSWEQLSYEGSQPERFIERLASRFRTVGERMDIACGILDRNVEGRTVLDLGCGSGILGLRLIESGAARVSGIDFSENAIEVGIERARQHGVDDRLIFSCDDILDASFPDVDIVTALGVLDYLDGDQIEDLFRKVYPKSFLFSFLEREWGVFQIMHSVYVKYRRVPGVHRYRKEEVLEAARRAGYDDPQFAVPSMIYSLPGDYVR